MTGSLAFSYFQLHNINTGFRFALGAKQRKVEHYSVFTYFGPCLAVTEWTMNPAGIFFSATQSIALLLPLFWHCVKSSGSFDCVPFHI